MSACRQGLRLVSFTMVLLVLGLTVATANADTIYVCWDGSGDYVTIQEGIDAAEDGDEVVVCDGVYTGPRNKNLDLHGKGITVRSENGPDNCIIDCQGYGRGFCLYNYEAPPSLIDGFTITHGNADGGGIHCSEPSPTISNCTITGNTGGMGGGIRCYNSSPTIINCTITGNTASRGGGLYSGDLDPTIVNCTITGNVADDRGGGITCRGNPTIINCLIGYNSAGNMGGGIDSDICSPTIVNCVIRNNAARYGAGMSVLSGYPNSKPPTIVHSTIMENTGERGGGFYLHPGGMIIVNCVIKSNIALLGAGAYGHGRITNCILWNNAPDQISGDAVVTYCDVQGGWPGAGNINADPLFLAPGIGDLHLRPGSPCIDAGCNAGVPPDTTDLDDDGDTTESTPFDLDGEGRFFDDPDTPDTGCGCPPIVDMGLYEFGGTGPQPCPGDLDCDRLVGHSDLGILLSAWQTTGEGDLNCDGETDQADLGILLTHWGEGCP